MKKVSAIIVALLLVATTAISAFAAGLNADEQKVIDTVKVSVDVNGAEVSWPDSFVNQLENYFNTIELTADQADAIIAAFEEGKTLIKNNGVTDISKASTAVKHELFAVLQKAAAALDATASYDKTTGNVTITAADGTEILKVVPTLVVKGDDTSKDKDGNTTDGGVIKTTGTGANTMMIVVVSAAAALVVAGGVLFVLKKRA